MPADHSAVRFTAEGLPNPTSGAVDALAPREVLKAFLKDHPNYVIDPFAMPPVGGSSMDSGPLMAIAAGIPPHAMYVNFRQSSTYVAQGFLEPLETLLARVLSPDERVRQFEKGKWIADPTAEQVAEALAMIKQRVPKPAWPVVYRADDNSKTDSNTPHVWAIPLSNRVGALVYRRDLFIEAGLDPDRPPANWDEWLEYSRKLTNPKEQRYGHMFRGSGDTVSWAIYEVMASNGAEAMRQDEGTGEWRAAYGNRGAAEAVYHVWRMLHEPFTPPAYGKETAACAFLATGPDRLRWEQGKVAMQFGGIDEELISTVDPALYGIAPIPASPRGTSAGQVNARMNGVYAGSDPQQKLAAMRYIWFATSTEAKKIRTQVYVENGYGKFVSPDLLQQFGYERLLRQVSKGWQETFNQSMESGVPEPYGKNTQHIYRWMSEPINTVLDDPTLAGLSGDRDAALIYIQKLLEASADKVNREVLSPPTAQTMRTRRLVAVPVLILVTLAFGYGLWDTWRSFSRISNNYFGKRHWRRYVYGYLLLLPVAILMVLWAYAPLGMGLSISFLDFQIVRGSTWAGIDNFANILFDHDKFWMPLWRTFYFVALTIGLGFWPPILLAILLQEVPTATGKYVFRTIFYLPAVVSGLVVMFLWRQLYDPTEYGVLNQILLSFNNVGPVAATMIKLLLLGFWASLVGLLLWLPFKIEEMGRGLKLAMVAVGLALLGLSVQPFLTGGVSETISSLVGSFHLKPLKWTADPALAMFCVVLPHVWAASGPGCILYLAALKSVPDELYEAADIDAAGHWHKVFYIVLPSLKYILVVQFVGAVTGAFKGGVEMIMVMTGGGPNNTTSILALEMFYRVFLDLQFGIGTAMAWVLGALLIGFTAYQLKMLANAEFKAGGSEKN